MSENSNFQNVYLSDIAGYAEEKAEAQKIIDIFRNYEELRQHNISIPRGLCLAGNPGVGKTLLAKAIATESHVPFFEFEANEEASETETVKSLKELFRKAREAAPSIIFIDELDELVPSDDFASDYCRKTLKILLSEIDGAVANKDVMVIATTNHYECINPALFRSGRIDKRIEVELPDYESRTAITQLYLDKCGIHNISAAEIANRIAGFSGADIKNLVNESLIHANVVEHRSEVTMEDFEESMPVIRFKGIKKATNSGDDTVCYHEIGHFLMGYLFKNKVGEISLEKHGEVEGHVLYLDEEETEIYMPHRRRTCSSNVTSANYMDELCVALGGYAAEKVMLGCVSLGSASDLHKAVSMIRSMMNGGFFGFEYMNFNMGFQVPLSKECEKKCADVLNEALNKTQQALEEHRDLINYIRGYLATSSKLSSKELRRILNNFEDKKPN